jgi:F-type H+-transporting ATPase subunit c
MITLTPKLLHYISAGITIMLGGIGGGIGQGIAASNCMESMTRQPTGNEAGFKSMVIGLALIESGVIIALVTTLLMLLGGESISSLGQSLAELGIALAVGISAITISISSSFVVKAATASIARQPFFAPKITAFMLLAQSIIEAPVIFAFIIGLVIKTHITPEMTYEQGLQGLAAGLALALGCIGPSIGQSYFTHTANIAVGINKSAYSKLFPFSLISAAIIETPIIFCLLLALLIMFSPLSTQSMNAVTTFLTAVITMGLGAIGGGLAIGYVTSQSAQQIAHDVNNYPLIIRASLLGIAFIESAIIYALIISLLLVMKVTHL